MERQEGYSRAAKVAAGRREPGRVQNGKGASSIARRCLASFWRVWQIAGGDRAEIRTGPVDASVDKPVHHRGTQGAGRKRCRYEKLAAAQAGSRAAHGGL